MRRPTLPAIFCPHCRTKAVARSSEEILPTCREVRMMCPNPECAHVFVAEITVVRTIAPSLRPDPAVIIPGGNCDRRRPPPRPDNDNPPAPANDDNGRPAARDTMG